MDDVQAYAGSFVVLEPSEIFLTDPDQDGDLDKYTDIKVTYTPTGGQPISWPVICVTPIFTTLKDATGNPILSATGSPIQVVNSVNLLVIPKVPPLGCLGVLTPSFLRFGRKQGEIKDGPTSGPVSGTMGPPQGQPPVGVVGTVKGTRTFSLPNPLIFYGTMV